LPATLPFEEEFINDKTAPFLEKYIKRKNGKHTPDSNVTSGTKNSLICTYRQANI
jgi:hypothetical protein